MKSPCLFLVALLQLSLSAQEAEMRTWHAVGGFRTEAAFLEYKDGTVRLKKTDGTEISVRLEQLAPQDRAEVIRLAGDNARGVLPAGQQIDKPTGRRELTWKELVRGDLWHKDITEKEKAGIDELGKRRPWQHAETEYFIVHYQQVDFAKRTARMADFQYQFIAADLPGFKERETEKSHIVVFRSREDWQKFLELSGGKSWAAAYVRGMVIYVYDFGSGETSAAVIAHEMSHLVLNRFFRYDPPLWLNEGLAEWYGTMGWNAFKGQKVNPKDGLGRMRDPYDVATLTSMRNYPGGDEAIFRFYATSRQLVGMLMLRKDQPAFVRFLQTITVEGKPFTEALAAVYEIKDLTEFQKEFDKFL